jgi:asparagine synthetase B (glutamine-hydrolysing)
MRALMPWMDLDLASLRFYFERHARVRRGALERAYGFYPENTAMWDALMLRAPEVLSARARGALAQVVDEERAWFRSEIAPHVEGASVLHANLYYEVAVRLPSWVLHMGDRMSAAHGVELRLPYLDDEVVEGMLALPEGDRLRGLSEKHILRAVHHGRVPETIRRRRKQPLYTPIRAWLGDLGEQGGFDRYWSAERFAQVGLFDFDACERRRVAMVRGDHADGLDRMVTEWAVSMALSTHVLDTKLREATNAS